MKMIGLLGGMGWPSTTTYYRSINERVNSTLGGLHSARILIWSDDFAVAEAEQRSEDWDAAGARLALAARQLEASGAEIIGIACNTMHMVAAEIRAELGIPLVDMVEATASRVAELGMSRVGLLGTPTTMSMPAYQHQFASRSVELALPSEAEHAALGRAIYEELGLGLVRPSTESMIHGIIDRMVADRVDGIVLACTELSLVVDATAASSVPILDTTAIHVDALIAASLDSSVARDLR